MNVLIMSVWHRLIRCQHSLSLIVPDIWTSYTNCIETKRRCSLMYVEREYKFSLHPYFYADSEERFAKLLIYSLMVEFIHL